jgi:hypothetical protein
MRSKSYIHHPDGVEVSIECTMTVKEWGEIYDWLYKEAPHYHAAVGRFGRLMRDTIEKVKTVHHESIERKGADH